MLASARCSFSRRALNVNAKESRIGIRPIPVPKGVTISIDGNVVKAKVSAWGITRARREAHTERESPSPPSPLCVVAAAAAARELESPPSLPPDHTPQQRSPNQINNRAPRASSPSPSSPR
jgi:hypothetical protein